jgi:HD domain
MTESIGGIQIPDTAAASEATELVRDAMDRLMFDHSRRVFLFGMVHAQRFGLVPDPELLYLSALFHDTGLGPPYGGHDQRFELDGADAARMFLRDRGFSSAACDVVWMAIALHTTPEIPGRMAAEIAVTNFGVLTDLVAWNLDQLPADTVGAITAAHPRGEFKKQILRAFVDGTKDRPHTTYGTVSADVLEHFVPGFHRTTMIERVMDSSWPE